MLLIIICILTAAAAARIAPMSRRERWAVGIGAFVAAVVLPLVIQLMLQLPELYYYIMAIASYIIVPFAVCQFYARVIKRAGVTSDAEAGADAA